MHRYSNYSFRNELTPEQKKAQEETFKRNEQLDREIAERTARIAASTSGKTWETLFCELVDEGVPPNVMVGKTVAELREIEEEVL